MKHIQGISSSNSKFNRLRAGVGMLLFAYIAVFLFPHGIVPHVHHDLDVHAGDSCKKDACHISIYHPGDEGGCDHKNHFTKADKDCPLCHITGTRQFIPSAIVHENIVFSFECQFPDILSDEPAIAEILHADRGPPAQMLI